MSLTASGLGVTYQAANRDVHALADVDLNVEAGEFITLIGPSGCGKSTLLHCLGGLLTPSAGRVDLNGTQVERPQPERAAFVFQDYSLLPWKTIVDNAAIGLRFAGRSRAQRQAKAMELLELVGLTQFAQSYPQELSGGMQQRVAIARAMAMEPDTLLMDEPFGALDEQTRRQLGYEMSSVLTRNGKTVLMVTHSLDEAIFWADRIVVMSPRPGRIIKELRVDAPRPRELHFIATPEFGELRAELFDLLDQVSTGAATTEDPPPKETATPTGDAAGEPAARESAS